MEPTGLTIRINVEGLDEVQARLVAIRHALEDVKEMWLEVSALMQLKPEVVGNELFLCSKEHCVPGSE